MNIPDEAVEAAARALHFFKTGAGWKDADPATVWECREQAESILGQAAPHMLAEAKAEALEEAAADGWIAVTEYAEYSKSIPPVGYLHNWLLACAKELRSP